MPNNTAIFIPARLASTRFPKKMLADLVKKLNKIKDLTEEVLDLREEVDEREVTFNLKLEEVLYEGLVEVMTSADGKRTLNCK